MPHPNGLTQQIAEVLSQHRPMGNDRMLTCICGRMATLACNARNLTEMVAAGAVFEQHQAEQITFRLLDRVASREIWVGPDGSVLEGVHPASECAGRACCLHAPSDHLMKDWRLHWRDDRSLMERLCAHGIGHPDPDDLAYKDLLKPGSSVAESIHGCDGCCHGQGPE